MTSALSPTELGYIRRAGQFSKLFLAVHQPEIVFSCLVNQAFATPASKDKVFEVLWDGAITGAYTDVLAGMTCLVGSAEGLSDYGIVRIRKVPNATTMFVCECSDVLWVDDAALTIIDEFGLGAKHPRVLKDGSIYMDYDVDYSDQHTAFAPVPVMGSHMVIWNDGDLVINGNFPTNTDEWSKSSALMVLSVASNAMLIDLNGIGGGYAYQDVATVAGRSYSFSVDVSAYSHGYDVVVDGITRFTQVDGTGVKTVEIVASSALTRIAFYPMLDNAATLTVDSVSLTHASKVEFDGSNSWCLAAGAKTYLWSTTGGTVVDETTATPTFTYLTTGVKRVACTVTVGTASWTGYRYVFVYSDATMPVTNVILGSCTGSQDIGGWEFEVTVYGTDCSKSVIRDRAMVIVFARDFYGDDEVGIGAEVGRENIICLGWVMGESIILNPVESVVSFQCAGAHHWMGILPEFIDGIESQAAAADEWTNVTGLTVDKALWHLFTWRSTLTSMMDWYPTNDTRQALELQAGQGSLWTQVYANCEPIFAKPIVDRLGRLFTEIEAQLITPASRSAFPVVLTLTEIDWQEELSVTRIPVSATSLVAMSGIYYADNQKPLAFFSLATGHVFKRYGETEEIERVLLEDQTTANELCGLVLGWRNHEYEFEIKTASNNRMVDIAPRQYVAMGITLSANPRGSSISDNILPRTVSMEHDLGTGFLSQVWTGENETFAENNIDGDIPEINDDPDWSLPPIGGFDIPTLPLVVIPPALPNPNHPTDVIVASTNFGIRYTQTFAENSPKWLAMNTGLSADNYNDVGKMIVCPSGGIFIMCNGSIGAGYENIYFAEQLGSVWRRVAHYTDLDSPLHTEPPENDGMFRNIEFNPQASEEVNAMTLRYPDKDGMSSVYSHIGDRSGFGAGERIIHVKNHYMPALACANGKWFTCTLARNGVLGVYHTPVWFNLKTGDCDFWTNYVYSNGNTGFDNYFGNQFSIGFSSIEKILTWGTNHSHGALVAPPATTGTDISFNPDYNMQALAVSPVGSKIMGCDKGSGLFTPYRSSDGGVTFDSMSAVIPVGMSVWDNCKDDFRWVYGGGTNVKLTLEFGEAGSNYDKEGDLITFCPLINITALRFVK